MSNRPKLEEFSDPIRFFRATHTFLLGELDRLENLLNQVEAEGQPAIDANRDAWIEVTDTLSRKALWHEDDEEAVLFPVMAKQLPHVGFQPSDSAFRFLIDGHEVMEERTKQLVSTVEQGLNRAENFNPTELLAAGRELVSLYRDHIETEEEKVYSIANRNLTPEQRISMMNALNKRHDANSQMPIPRFYSTHMEVLRRKGE